MSETYMVMVLVPIMAPFTCIGAGETRATQIWARVTTRAAVGNCKRHILLQSISARSVPEGSDGGPAAGAGPHPPVSGRQTAGDRDQSGRPKVSGKPAPETRAERCAIPVGAGGGSGRASGGLGASWQWPDGWDAAGTAGGRRAGRPEPRCPPSRSGIEWPRPSSAGYFRDDRWSRRRAPDPAPVVGVGVVIQHRHVGDLLAIVARVKPIAVIVGVESRRHHLDRGVGDPWNRRQCARLPEIPAGESTGPAGTPAPGKAERAR